MMLLAIPFVPITQRALAMTPPTQSRIRLPTGPPGARVTLSFPFHADYVGAYADAYSAAAAADEADATLVEVQGALNIATAPLWPIVMPSSVVFAWDRLKGILLPVEQGWEVWIDWYEDRLFGKIPLPELEVTCVTLSRSLWRRGPKAVNAEIRRLIERTLEAPESAGEPIPLQGAGPHFTLNSAALIALALPAEIDASGNNLARIRQLTPLARRAADDLAGRLNPNAFPELARTVADYRMAFAAEETVIPWGTVFGLGVMLQTAAVAARRQVEDRLQPPLEDAAQSALDSLLTLHGPLILATAEGRELSDEADRMRLTREEQTRLRANVHAVADALQRDREVIEPPAAELADKATGAMNEGVHPERGTVFGTATIKNVTITLIGVAAVSATFGFGPIEAGAALVSAEALKKSVTFSALTSMLGQNVDRVFRVGAAHRRFVVANQEPLRQIAVTNGQSGWMLPHIDHIVRAEVAQQSPPSEPRSPDSSA